MAQPTFDSSASNNSGSATAASVTASHTIGGGSDRFVLVAAHVANRGVATISATYNGTSMTALSGGAVDSATGWYTAFFFLKEASLPGAGTYNAVVSSTTNKRMVVTVMSWSSVDQTTSTGTPVTNFGNSAGPATATVSLGADDVAADAVSVRGAASQSLSTSLGQQQVDATTSGTLNNNVHGGCSSDATAARSWTLGASAEWSIVAVPIQGIAGISASDYVPPVVQAASSGMIGGMHG